MLSTEEKVILLALLTKEEGENLRDVLAMLEESRVFSMKEGRRLCKVLKNEGYIQEGQLTLKGSATARAAKAEFTLP